MKQSNQWVVVVLAIAGLQLSACERKSDTHSKIEPAHVEHIEGSELSRVTLTEKAVERIDLKTVQVEMKSGKKVVPYSALIYDPHGLTWVYTSPKPRTFVRHQVKVDRIEGELVFLSDGPPAGTVVASVGVAELYGTEYGVGH